MDEGGDDNESRPDTSNDDNIWEADARRAGVSVDEYILQLLTSAKKFDPPLRTGAEIMAYWEREGLLGNRPDIVDPSAFARELRERSERRERS